MTSSPAVLVSVLVPVLNESRHLRAAAAAICAQRFDGEIEFLFIDGGSHDETRAIVSELADRDPRIRLLENPDRYIPQALNIGLGAARGEYIARMDAHALYPERYVQLGVDRLLRGGVAWVSGPQIAVGTGSWSRAVALALSSPLGVGSARFRRLAAGELELASNGFCGVWRRADLEHHRGWDEDWPINEDSELAARMRAAGGRIVLVPAMAARYAPRESPGALARQYWRYGQYRAKTSLRHPESMRRSHAAPPLLVATLAAAAGPAWLARPARRLCGLYAVAVVIATAGKAAGNRRGEVALLPAVFATMQLTWGLGFLVGLVRFAARRRPVLVRPS